MARTVYPTEQCTKKTEHELWQRWCSIRNVCNNPKNHNYKYYGGRGIKVHEDWCDFWTFVDDVEREIGALPFKGAFLDRKDNNGDYAPGNIQWSTAKVNGNNRQSNLMVTAFGKTQSLATWSREFNIKKGTLWSRIVDYGMTPELALIKKKGK